MRHIIRRSISRLRRLAAISLPLATVAGLFTAIPASADVGIMVNCGGHQVMSANYVRLTNGSNSIVGSIQLCRTSYVYDGMTWYNYMARIEMYSPLPSNAYLANAYIYARAYSDGVRRVWTCDNTPEGHVTAGQRTCYTPWLLGVDFHDFQAYGREYHLNINAEWVKIAEGATIVVG
jgi:hypothetical protein